MIGWVLLAIAVGLFLVGVVREGFEATATIKAPPYDQAELKRIRGMISPQNKKILEDMYARNNPGGSPDSPQADAFTPVTDNVRFFYQEVYSKATTPITRNDIDEFIKKRSPPPGTREPFPGALADAQTKLSISKEVLVSYFMSGVGTSMRTGYADALAALGQGVGYSTPGATTAGATTGGPAGGMAGPRAGGTTGGSSVTSAAPNAGGGGKGKQVFGPTFTSLGAPVTNTDGDSTRNNQYPELMGGMGDTSVRGPGGIRNPSQNWLLSMSGALPSTASLGSDENSGYLPYSRTPGDQDLIPDPYRLNRNYSTSSYSSKTDPVPFLTDFSAFSK